MANERNYEKTAVIARRGEATTNRNDKASKLESQIDDLVFELYNLSDDEIKTIKPI